MSIYPADDCCPNTYCDNQIPLKKEYRKKAIVFTRGVGVQPAWNMSLYCQSGCYCPSLGTSSCSLAMATYSECHTSYHNNYSVCNGQRTYSPGIPELIEIGEHQFVEVAIVKMWCTEMLFGWFVLLKLRPKECSY